MSRWAPHVTVATVVEDTGGRFLMVEEAVGARLVLNQPAGHLEDGEGLAAAAVRETLEETAWEVRPTAVIGLYRWRHPASGETFLRTAFLATPVRHHPRRALDPEIRQVHWLDEAALDAAADRWRSPLVGRVISDLRAGARYPLALLREPG